MKHKKGFYERFIKVPQDVILASVALIFLSPVLLILTILVRSKLGSPIIFKQERAGKDGKPFYMYKFRSMSDARDENGEISVFGRGRTACFNCKKRNDNNDAGSMERRDRYRKRS